MPLRKGSEQFDKPVAGSLPTIIRSFKATVTKQINEFLGTPGRKFWQRNHYEHIIRNYNELYNIRRYIKFNPVKWDIEKVARKIWIDKNSQINFPS